MKNTNPKINPLLIDEMGHWDFPRPKTYSEEDMRSMYDKSCGLIGLGELDDQTENDNRFRELLEQVKK
jgi:hypothetical protein